MDLESLRGGDRSSHPSQLFRLQRRDSSRTAHESENTIDVPRGRSLERARRRFRDRLLPFEESLERDWGLAAAKAYENAEDARKKFIEEQEARQAIDTLKRHMGKVRIAEVKRRLSQQSQDEHEREQSQHERDQEDSNQNPRIDDYVWDVSRSKDITVHLELNLLDDLGPDLDAFLRLTRLGHFNAARDFFHDNLEEREENPYVFVLYAHMLLDSADYEAVTALEVPSDLNGNQVSVLQDYWRLIELVATFHVKGALETDDESVVEAAILSMSRLEQYGSTEIRVLNLAFLALCRFYPYPTSREISNISQFAWNDIYQDLLDEGRVWDFRDLYIALAYYYGPEDALLKFLGSSRGQADALDILMEDWYSDTFDESTSLALLDIMAALYPVSWSAQLGPHPTLRRWLEYTEKIASSLAKADADLLMTRPYLRWSLAKLGLSTHRPTKATNLISSYPGQFVFDDLPHYLPVYTSSQRETVDWTLLALPSHANLNIELISNVAKQLGDLGVQSLCYQMLILRSPDPLEYVKDLTILQTTTQHDTHGLMNTFLFKYMLCKGNDSRRNLRSDIMSIEHWEYFEKPLQWARYMVLRAVSDPDYAESWLKKAETLYNDLPIFIQDRIKERNPNIGDKEKGHDRQYPAKGTTRIPARLVSERALIDLGYQFYHEGNTVIVRKALGRDNIDDLIKLSEEYKEADMELWSGDSGREMTRVRKSTAPLSPSRQVAPVGSDQRSGYEIVKVDIDPSATESQDEDSLGMSSLGTDRIGLDEHYRSQEMGARRYSFQSDDSYTLPRLRAPSRERRRPIEPPAPINKVETADTAVQTETIEHFEHHPEVPQHDRRNSL
ncbi:hypothetical protein VP1G_02406 [Cytospora mali]|uniref:DUF8035 domain-containing protein n=1 Tax=Cytospora mali TaxID=578113 RepID=A0A194UTB5_CYTMA|nr:hypothetical protein VP1G_02406 [Valsa mali var. pyri (nom. inval.)]